MQFKTIVFAFSVIGMVACSKNEPSVTDGPVIDQRFNMTESYSVQVQEGYVTRVSCGKELLALTDLSMMINVPKGAKLTVEEFLYADLPEFNKGTGVAFDTAVLMFEDSKNADYDYNDLILYVRHCLVIKEGQRTFDVSVKPIAMGATQPAKVKFGYVDATDKKEVVLTEDVRSDYFGNLQGAINTYKSQPFVEPISTDLNDIVDMGNYRQLIRKNSTEDNSQLVKCGYFQYLQAPTLVENNNPENLRLNYFIEIEGQRLYVAEVGSSVGGKLPYGIAVPSRIDAYPHERQRIDEVFPLFNEWITNPSYSNQNWNLSNEFIDKGYKIDDVSAVFNWYNWRRN